MAKKTEVLAVIPARGNSKSIPRKNIRNFAGHPLIAYSIAAGLQAEKVTRVIVSTDNEEIAQVSANYGAEVPFKRPDEFAKDETPDLPVFRHALHWLQDNEDYNPEIVVHLRPTSPVRPVDCVDSAIKLLLDNPEADSVRGVVIAGQNPYKMWQIKSDGQMMPLLHIKDMKEAYNVPRQELPPVYWQTGHIDAIRVSTIMKKNSMSGDVIIPLIMDPLYTVDIDTLYDWRKAEQLLQSLDIEMVAPFKPQKSFPDKVALLVLDFDGVLTDDRVWVDQNGREMVAVSRSDGLGLELLRKQTEIEVIVISKERNPVVAARCKKLGLQFYQGIDNKSSILDEMLKEKKIDPQQIIYLGNDINDISCFDLVGFAVAPIDAHPEVSKLADLVLQKPGGLGAVRELCDLLITKYCLDQNR
ncbi:MAG TPA: N-acylneuraminate cytidylyltransferase [Anaerolineae bacterium]|nr:N-acylneuraminate cytidylyltransferase [Anaerolineae bacterium]